MAESRKMHCCALHHLIIQNFNTIEEVKNAINAGIKKEKPFGTEPTAWFAVTKPSETQSISILESLGFKRMSTFPRCSYYDNSYTKEDGPLTLWFVTKAELSSGTIKE